jgi:hypothetical protein
MQLHCMAPHKKAKLSQRMLQTGWEGEWRKSGCLRCGRLRAGAWALAAAAGDAAAAAVAAFVALAWCPKSEKSCQRADDLPSLQPSTLAAGAQQMHVWCKLRVQL